MKPKNTRPARPWWIRLNLLPGIVNLLCLAFFFLPLTVYVSSSGQGFLLSSTKLLFGGAEVFLVDGVMTSFYYQMNIWLLADMQVFLLSAIAGFLCKGSTKLTIIGILLEIIGIGMTASILHLINWVSPGLTLANLRFGIGPILLLIGSICSLFFFAFYAFLLVRHKRLLKAGLDKGNQQVADNR